MCTMQDDDRASDRVCVVFIFMNVIFVVAYNIERYFHTYR